MPSTMCPIVRCHIEQCYLVRYSRSLSADLICVYTARMLICPQSCGSKFVSLCCMAWCHLLAGAVNGCHTNMSTLPTGSNERHCRAPVQLPSSVFVCYIHLIATCVAKSVTLSHVLVMWHASLHSRHSPPLIIGPLLHLTTTLAHWL